MTAPRTILRIALGTTGASIQCALGLLFMGVTSFATVYLIELSTSLRNVENMQDARRLFDSVCMTFPQSFEGAIPDSLAGWDAALRGSE